MPKNDNAHALRLVESLKNNIGSELAEIDVEIDKCGKVWQNDTTRE